MRLHQEASMQREAAGFQSLALYPLCKLQLTARQLGGGEGSGLYLGHLTNGAFISILPPFWEVQRGLRSPG